MNQQNNWQQGVWHADASAAQPQQPVSAPAAAQPQPQQQAYAQPYQAQAYPQQPYAQAQAQQPYAQQPVPNVPGAAAAAQPQPKSRGWIVGLAVVIAIAVLCLAGVASCTSMVNSSMSSFGSLGGMFDMEEYGYEMAYEDTVGIIELNGTIQYDGTVCSPEGLKEQLDRAEGDPNIVAVVLRVDSGGGTATAGEEMSNYVRDFSKPIVVSSASINASAAYEISSQTDYIFVAKTTAIGSIGTALQITDLSGLYEKLGISIENITSSDSKDSSYGTRALSDEERAWYQDQVDQINETFIEAVAAGRNMDIEDVRKLANGMTYTGMAAVENGLADEVGTLEDAIAKACELAGVPVCETMYLTQGYYQDIYSLLGLMEGGASAQELAAALKELEQNVGFKG